MEVSLIRTPTALLILVMAFIVGALSALLGLYMIVAGFTDDMIWSGVLFGAPLPLIGGLVALAFATSHVTAISRHGA